MATPRLLGLLCARNEADRYLARTLEWHFGALDEIFVYDDCSTDDTADIADAYGAFVDVRPEFVSSFDQHEGDFRQAAWEAFEVRMRPTTDDWVLAFDADEFLVSPRQIEPYWLLTEIAEQLVNSNMNGCRVKIHEVFDRDSTGRCFVRIDGYWGGISGLRFFRYQPGGRFANRRLGCGSAPTYVDRLDTVDGLELLHLGYARPEDRVTKHNRYFGLPGHNPQHIASIIATPTLIPWTGAVPL